jgi:hypothetical protein
MARKATTQETKVITLTEAQFEALKSIASLVNNSHRHLSSFDEVADLGAAGFYAGQAYALIDKADDDLDELLEAINPDCEECDEDF